MRSSILRGSILRECPDGIGHLAVGVLCGAESIVIVENGVVAMGNEKADSWAVGIIALPDSSETSAVTVIGDVITNISRVDRESSPVYSVYSVYFFSQSLNLQKAYRGSTLSVISSSEVRTDFSGWNFAQYWVSDRACLALSAFTSKGTMSFPSS